jgi:hypothetical protein
MSYGFHLYQALTMFLRKLLLLLPPLNYMTFHYLYFIATILLFSVIFWLSSRPEQSIAYIDCLFMVTSAITETGLNTFNLSQINTVQQVLLFLLLIGGSSIFVSYFVVLVRKRASELKVSELVNVHKVDRKDSAHNIRGSLRVLFHSSPNLEKQCGIIGVPPRIETRLSSSTITLHNPISGNESSRSTADLLQCGGIMDPSSQPPAPAGDLKNTIGSHLKTKEKSDELNCLGSWIAGRTEGLGILSMKDQPASTEPVTALFIPSRISEDEELRSRNELEQFDPNAWSRQDRVGRHITHNFQEVITFSSPIGEHLSRTISNADSRIAREDRMQLGGAEYRTIKLLTYLIPIYFVI